MAPNGAAACPDSDDNKLAAYTSTVPRRSSPTEIARARSLAASGRYLSLGAVADAVGLSESTLRRHGVKITAKPELSAGRGVSAVAPTSCEHPAATPVSELSSDIGLAAASPSSAAGSDAQDTDDSDIAHRWTPIKDLSAADIAASDNELNARVERWRTHQTSIDTATLRVLNDQTKREWAIETGVIEMLYTLDDMTTRRLITQGVDSSLIPADASDQPPEDVAAMIQDHADTVDWLHDLADGARPLSTSLIKQLHQFMTRRQHTAAGFDIFGRRQQIPLVHGAFKTRPNNPRRAGDRKLHQYCPPEQVDSEIDRLIEAHHQHTAQQAPPDVSAAWLHHRFVQIHPFQDGNGRVARAISSLVLLQARWFPLVVTRRDRSRYLDALADADDGDLGPLVSLVGVLQNRCLDHAFGL